MGADSYHFTPDRRPRKFGTWDGKRVVQDDLEIVKVKCANCYNYVRTIAQIIQVYKLREGDPRIAQTGKDKIFKTENWCLQCMRGANMEDDSSKVMLGVGYGSS